MKKNTRLFLLTFLSGILFGCSFHSYQSAITEIKIPHYREPDSLNMVDEKKFSSIHALARLLP